MTVLEKISEADLDDRSRDLQAELEAARVRLSDASKQAVFGEISDDELRPFRDMVDNLEAKQAGIDAARKDLEQAKILAARKRKAAAERRAAEAGPKIISQMAEERQQIDELLSAMAPRLKRLCELEDELERDVAPHMPSGHRLHVDGFRSRNTHFINGAVYRHGLSHWGMGTSQKPGGPSWAVSPKPPEDHDTLEALIEQDEANIAAAVEVLLNGMAECASLSGPLVGDK